MGVIGLNRVEVRKLLPSRRSRQALCAIQTFSANLLLPIVASLILLLADTSPIRYALPATRLRSGTASGSPTPARLQWRSQPLGRPSAPPTRCEQNPARSNSVIGSRGLYFVTSCTKTIVPAPRCLEPTELVDRWSPMRR